MSITLFAIIGATINAGVAYWILFGIHCACKVVKIVGEILSAKE